MKQVTMRCFLSDSLSSSPTPIWTTTILPFSFRIQGPSGYEPDALPLTNMLIGDIALDV